MSDFDPFPGSSLSDPTTRESSPHSDLFQSSLWPTHEFASRTNESFDTEILRDLAYPSALQVEPRGRTQRPPWAPLLEPVWQNTFPLPTPVSTRRTSGTLPPRRLSTSAPYATTYSRGIPASSTTLPAFALLDPPSGSSAFPEPSTTEAIHELNEIFFLDGDMEGQDPGGESDPLWSEAPSDAIEQILAVSNLPEHRWLQNQYCSSPTSLMGVSSSLSQSSSLTYHCASLPYASSLTWSDTSSYSALEDGDIWSYAGDCGIYAIERIADEAVDGPHWSPLQPLERLNSATRLQATDLSQFFECGLHPKSYDHLGDLRRHESTHSERSRQESSRHNSARFSCKIPRCQFSSKRKSDLKRHVQGIHAVEWSASVSPAIRVAGSETLPDTKSPMTVSSAPHTSTKCPVCGKEPIKFLQRHMTKHTPRYRCAFRDCNLTFTTDSDLKRHKRIIHQIVNTSEPQEGYRCASDKCARTQKLWRRPDNFKQHVLIVHKNEDIEDLLERSKIPDLDALANPIEGVNLPTGSFATFDYRGATPSLIETREGHLAAKNLQNGVLSNNFRQGNKYTDSSTLPFSSAAP